LAEHGAVVIDSDVLAREVVEPGTPGHAAVVTAFGPSVVGRDGALDRPALARLVFSDSELLAVLNGIVHPLVRARADSIASCAPDDAIVVQDVPLLVETGLADAFDLVVVVDAPEEDRVNRMIQDRAMSAEQVRERIAVQADRQQRIEAADYVLDNSGTRAALLAQVDRLWADLRRATGLSEPTLTVEP
jgi:dephospho-CoA kinase